MTAYRPDLLGAPLGEATMAQRMAADPDVKPLDDNGGDRKTEEGRSVLQRNTDSRGNDNSYLVRRLKRDAPKVAEALARGEYRVLVR